MANYRVIAQIPYFTAIPEDITSNVFHFATVSPSPILPADVVEIADRLDAFYLAIDAYLSPSLNNAGGTYRIYDMADPLPRTPIQTFPMATLTLGAAGYAEEVAICCSWKHDVTSGQNPARARGRTYVGPLAVAATNSGTGSTFSRPAPAAISAIAAAGAALATTANGVQFCIWSPTDQVMRAVDRGYVDNSFDTQRRRGRIPNARTLFTGAP